MTNDKVDLTKIRSSKVMMFKEYINLYVSEELKATEITELTEGEKVKIYIQELQTCKLSKIEAQIYTIFKMFKTTWDIESDIPLGFMILGGDIKRFYHFIDFVKPTKGQRVTTELFNNYRNKLKRENKAIKNTNVLADVKDYFKR